MLHFSPKGLNETTPFVEAYTSLTHLPTDSSGPKTSEVPGIVERSQIKGNCIQVTAECRFPYTLFFPFFFSNLFIRSEGNVTIAIHKVPS